MAKLRYKERLGMLLNFIQQANSCAGNMLQDIFAPNPVSASTIPT